jgi:hypothetical protein
MTTALEVVRGQRHASTALYPQKDSVSIVQEAGWAPEPVSTGAGNLAQPRFDPRTAQPIASRSTGYSTRKDSSGLCLLPFVEGFLSLDDITLKFRELHL